MRGRTLNDSFIILDEAQNTTREQMKMFLTRLGFGSKIVVTGDVTQVDLPDGQISGLRVVQEILDGIPDIHFARLTSTDVVRHKLVGKIVDAYERYDAQPGQQTRDRDRGRARDRSSDHAARPRRTDHAAGSNTSSVAGDNQSK
jgi:phosphate starvation-inducible PhoH-like protein